MDNKSKRKLPKGFDESTLKSVLARLENYERVEDVALDLGLHKKTLSAAIRFYTGAAKIQDLHTKPRQIDPKYKAATKMVKEGKSLKQVADKFQVSKQAVSVWLRKAGIDKSPRPAVMAKKKQDATDLLNQGSQPTAVMRKTGLSKTAITKLVRELKIPRPTSDAPKRLAQYSSAVADIRAGMLVSDVAKKHAVSYITVARWARELKSSNPEKGQKEVGKENIK